MKQTGKFLILALSFVVPLFFSGMVGAQDSAPEDTSPSSQTTQSQAATGDAASKQDSTTPSNSNGDNNNGNEQEKNGQEKTVSNPEPQADAELDLSAKLTDKGEDVTDGLIWRVFQPIYGVDNKLPLVATSNGGNAHFNLQPGSYIIHVSFGRAYAMKRVSLEHGQKLSENMVLNAGGLELNATIPEGKINPQYLKFSIYSDDSENDDTALILSDVDAGKIIRLKAGTYHIVSNYGTANATSRSDIRVDAGKITEATMQHHAALVTLKLVRQEGGEALADTSWSITNDAGDIVRETVGAYASLVLAEGEYIAIAKNKDQIYQKVFTVTSGHDEDVDVIANAQSTEPIDDSMD
ncbi:MAG: hypothetical protein M3Z70_09040 [Bartonella sp.]|nr:hypothetical protein [Bartonella sp.]